METITVLSDKVSLHFSHPIPSVLGAKGIVTVGQMIRMSDRDLVSIRNFGTKTLEKVNEFRKLEKKANAMLVLNKELLQFS